MVEEPGIPGRLAAAIRVSNVGNKKAHIDVSGLTVDTGQSWPEPIAESKNKALFATTMLPWLDELHQKQIEAGIVSSDDKTGNYPF